MTEPVQSQSEPGPGPEADAARAEWMSVLARAEPAALAAALDALGPRPGFAWLRRPERGAVMVRGRQGGTGAPFNLGEMTVTRCTLQLSGAAGNADAGADADAEADAGAVGHAWVPGRDAAHAEAAALVDALMQTGAAAGVEAELLAPLRAAATARAEAAAGKAEATRVNFFTMARGDD